MSINEPFAAAPALPDRSLRLTLMGVFQIVLGILAALMGLFIVLGATLGPVARAPQGAAINLQSMISSVGFYLVAAAVFISLGIGSILARRWAWVLTVVLSWIWLVFGVAVFGTIMLFAGPMMSAAIQQQANAPPEAVLLFRIIAGSMSCCIYVFLPGLFLIFYQPESVRVTCLLRDPQVRWTDRCPMPVLAVSIVMAFAVVWMPLGVAYGPVIPVFGAVLSGAPGAAVYLLVTVAMVYCAWGAYRLKTAAWWGMLVLDLLGALNMVVTTLWMDFKEMYAKMRIPAAQLDLMQKTGMIETMSRSMFWMGLIGAVVSLGYLLYIRRYFFHNKPSVIEGERPS